MPDGLRRLLYVTGLALIALVPILGSRDAQAVQAGKTERRVGGITISPAFQDVTIPEGQASVTYQFSITNNTSEPYELSLSTVDFGSLDESGGVLFSGNAARSLNYRYGLSQYVTLERDRVVVEPKKTEKVPLTINNKESLSPGGHYGAVLVTPTSSGERPIKVEINQVLSSLLFVKKQGGEVYDLSLRSFDVERRLLSAPHTVGLRFQNAGNVHVVPRGILTITDPRGRVVKKGFINTGSGIVLPETFRRLSVPLENVVTAWMPGKYHLSIAYRYDGSAALTTREYDFFYINGWYLVAMVAALLSVIFVFVHKRSRRYIYGGFRRVIRVVKSLGKKLLQRY